MDFLSKNWTKVLFCDMIIQKKQESVRTMQEETLHVDTFPGENYKDYGNYLTVFSCGVQHPTEKPLHVIRKKGRIDYHLLYIESGSACVYYEGKARSLTKGQFILIPPGQPQEHIMGKDSVSYWIHFHGEFAERLLSDSGLSGGVYTAADPSDAGKIFMQFVHAMHASTSASENRKNALFLSVLCALTEKTDSSNVSDSVWPAVRYLQNYYNENPEIGYLSTICNLSRSHFLRVFKETVGTTPHQYLLSVRMDQAKRFLTDSPFSISDVSTMVGFEDSFYFSRIFKKMTGMTPREYRKTVKDKRQ